MRHSGFSVDASVTVWPQDTEGLTALQVSTRMLVVLTETARAPSGRADGRRYDPTTTTPYLFGNRLTESVPILVGN